MHGANFALIDTDGNDDDDTEDAPDTSGVEDQIHVSDYMYHDLMQGHYDTLVGEELAKTRANEKARLESGILRAIVEQAWKGSVAAALFLEQRGLIDLPRVTTM